MRGDIMKCGVCGSESIDQEICHTTVWEFCSDCGAVVSITDQQAGIEVRQS
jgi:hypothetical protein